MIEESLDSYNELRGETHSNGLVLPNIGEDKSQWPQNKRQ